MDNNLFRRSSLERISSPEQLNEYIKITNPGVWLILIALLSIMIAVGFWAFTGTIPETVDLAGIAFSKTEHPTTIYCYIPMSVSKRLSEGMSVQVSPDYAPREEYGYIYASVTQISKQPVTETELVQTFGSIKYVQDIIPPGNVVEVKITMESSGNKLKWSNQKGESINVSSGSYCNLLIVTKERKPYELVF